MNTSDNNGTDRPDTYRLSWRVLLAISLAFWIFATVSAVLYVDGITQHMPDAMRADYFAPWQARVLQYALLFPPLLGCYWLALRIGWSSLRRSLPKQLLLGIGFAMLARPALLAAMWLMHSGHTGAMPTEEVLPKCEKATPECVGWPQFFWAYIRSSGISSTADFLIRYGFGLALLTGAALSKRYHESTLRVATLERQWNAARLSALRMQLSPHALFNLLHVIRGQISWDPPAAQRMVVQLGDLLRRLLHAGEQEFSHLHEEIEFVRMYLELQQQRFADRLSIALPTNELPDVWVPSLILQPLVANAVTHSLHGHQEPVLISVTVAVKHDQLVITICNDTNADADIADEHIGIRNTRERLAVHFGDRASLRSARDGDNKWCAELRMPQLRDRPQAD